MAVQFGENEMFNPNSSQIIDIRSGLIFPWYVEIFLTEWFIHQNFSNSQIFEWGGGASSVWYAANSIHVDILETDDNWANEIQITMRENNLENFSIKVIDVDHASAPYGSQNEPTANMQNYLNYITTLNKSYDCIVIDGSYRDDAIPISIDYLNRGGYLIFDNYQQITSGYIQLSNQKYLDSMEQIYIGKKGEWQTAVWRK